ncbi:endonuclease V family protein [Melia azedarach]|uniref:Endonuclease V family protein n=1 Tax=Melia azedarach TaxID=155640 RepID=A0ACC1X8G2_MELAZ|nr:endonuclease V family protein [Melia azedarach]
MANNWEEASELLASQSPVKDETSDPAHLAQLNNWVEIQDELKKKLILEDDFTWKLSTSATTSKMEESDVLLKHIGGVDVSFSKEDPSIACGCLVVLDLQSLQIVYEDYSILRLQVPYFPGFLAFREVPVLLRLLEDIKNKANHFYPQVLMVDGNGLLHPRGFGLACHIGVLANLPTIGIGKNLHCVDGLTHSGVRKLFDVKENSDADIITLIGSSGSVWGVAMRSTPNTLKPIFVSIGHRISLNTTVEIAKMSCKFRVPEPIRQADIKSRDYLQMHHAGY